MVCRVVCFAPYPAENAATRHRILGYTVYWAERDIELTTWSFMSPAFYRRRRRFGKTATLEKALRFAAATLRLWWRCRRVGRFDAVIIQREAFPLGPLWFERMIARNKRCLIYDFDDAIWAPPSNGVNQRAFLWRDDRVAELISLCDHVVAGNEFLARYARAYNPRVTIIPTTYPDCTAPSARPGDALPVVVWIGSLGNAFYLDSVLPALEQAAAAHPFRLRLIGADDLDDIRSDRLDIERIRWTEAGELEGISTADIGIMPLVDAPYELGKCAFKLIQYFSVGLPVVASPVGMNADVVRPGENGFLATTPLEWTTALTTLLADRESRQRMGRAGRATYEREFTRECGARKWQQVFEAVALPIRRVIA